jgi:hypothetical protein
VAPDPLATHNVCVASTSTSSPVVLVLRLTLGLLAARTVWLTSELLLRTGRAQRHHVESILFLVVGVTAILLVGDRDDHRSHPTHRRLPAWCVFAAALMVAFVLYWPVLRLGFLSDDFVLIDRALRGEFVSPAHEFVRPLPLMLWRLVVIAGGGAMAIHALNVIFHGVNGALTWRLARQMGTSENGALVAGLLFLVWPTQVESVAWASGISDVLMTTLVLAAITICLGRAQQSSGRRIVLVSMLAVAALLTKETAAAIPALFLLGFVPGWMVRPPTRRELFDVGIVALVCTTFVVWRIVFRFSTVDWAAPVLSRYTVKELLSRVFGGLAVPFTADWIRRFPVVALLFAAVVLVVVITPALAGHRGASSRWLLLCAALWPVLAAAPALGYLLIGGYLEGSRYLYLPSAGWVILLVGSGASIPHIRHGALTVAIVCAALAVSYVQGRWLLRDWDAAAERREMILLNAHQALDTSSCATGTFRGAPESYRAAQLFRNGLDEAVRLSTGGGQSRVGRGTCEFDWMDNGFRRR